jgi:hypothetical protein
MLVCRHMKDPSQLLVIPLTFWSGIEQGFFGADFTAVSTTKHLSVVRNISIEVSATKSEICFVVGYLGKPSFATGI